MADAKDTKLSIIIRTVDQATSKIKAINDRLDAATKPTRDFKKALGELHEKSGLSGLVDGFKGVGSAVTDLVGKVAMVGGVVGLAVAGVFHLVSEFDDLGDKAERLGVSVDFLASMRYAAEKAGAPVESLDSGLQAFQENLGKAKAGMGRMVPALTKMYPPLLKQLQGTKSSEEALGLLADTMSKLKDPSKRAALALVTVGNSDLAPMLAKGSKGIKELTDRYAVLAPGMGAAAEAAGQTDDALHDLHAATDGVKAALVTGLAPALTQIVGQLTDWLAGHRAEVAEWAKNFGEKLPGAVKELATWIGNAYDKVSSFVESIGGLKTVAIAGAAVLAGPLLGALTSLGAAFVSLGGFMGALPTGALLIALTAIVTHLDEIREAISSITGEVKGPAEQLESTLKHVRAQSAQAQRDAGLIAAPSTPMEAVRFGYAYQMREQQHADATAGGPFAVMKRAMDVQARLIPERSSLSQQIPDMFVRQPDLSAQARNAVSVPGMPFATPDGAGASSSANPAKAEILVKFDGAPRGTRVSTDPKSTADVDLHMGYQLGFGQ